MQKSNEMFNVHGIMEETFVKYVFPRYPDLGHRLFKYFYINSKATTKYLGATGFRQQCERFLNILDDTIVLESYIKMFTTTALVSSSLPEQSTSSSSQSSSRKSSLNEYSNDDRTDIVKPDGFRALLKTCFQLTIAHQSDPDIQTVCPMVIVKKRSPILIDLF